jgi:hypothetical protein
MRHIIMCGLSVCTIIFHIFSQRARFLNKCYWKKLVIGFSLQHLSVTFFIVRRTERDMIKNMYWSSHSIRYSCPILMKLYLSRQILEKYSNINFHKNTSNGGRGVPCRQADRRTDMRKVTVTFPHYANAPKNNNDRVIIKVQRSSCRLFVI